MDLYGVIGYPIKHSLSPAMHNAAFKACGINAEYRKFEVKPEELEDFLLNRKDVKGFNITIPHKVRAKEILYDSKTSFHSKDQLHCIEMCGAINTVKREKDRVLYTNTDVTGFLQSLKEDLNFDYSDKRVFLIGCGGAGRAVIAALTLPGNSSVSRIYVYEINREVAKSAQEYFKGVEYLKTGLEFISKDDMPDVIKNCQLLVNASPVGMKEGDGSVIDKELLYGGLSVYDVIYNRETQLVKDAKEKGLHAINGRGMFLYQGTAAFEFWTGKKAPIDVMKEALDRALI